MPAHESHMRQLTRSLALHAQTLSRKVKTQPGLQNVYDSICEVLNYLNSELAQEPVGTFSGPIADTWSDFKSRYRA